MSNKEWGVWSKITNAFTVYTIKNVDNSTIISMYPELSCSIYNFRNGDIKGFPSEYGTLKTYRVNQDLGSMQEFTDINNNITYNRIWNGSWGQWCRQVKVVKNVEPINIQFGDIPAGKTVEKEVTVSGVSNTDFVQVNVVNSMNSALILFATIPAIDKVRIRIFNSSDETISVNDRYFKIMITN